MENDDTPLKVMRSLTRKKWRGKMSFSERGSDRGFNIEGRGEAQRMTSIVAAIGV